MRNYSNYAMDCTREGLSTPTIIIAGIALLFALLWLNEALKPSPQPAPKEPPKEPPKAPPKSAPGLPHGAADAVEGELRLLQAQLSAFGYDRLDPLVGPATHRIVGLVKDYESRVERMHAKAKKEIEDA